MRDGTAQFGTLLWALCSALLVACGGQTSTDGMEREGRTPAGAPERDDADADPQATQRDDADGGEASADFDAPDGVVPPPAGPQDPSSGAPDPEPSTSADSDDDVDRIVVNECTNYSLRSSLSFRSVGVKPNSDLEFDWSALRHDFLGRELDPFADVDMLALLLWNLSEEEFATKMSEDDVQANDLVIPTQVDTEAQITSTSLLELTSFGMPLESELLLGYFDPTDYPPDAHLYTLLLTTGEVLGEGVRMFQVFRLDPDSEETRVAITDDSTELDYAVDIQGATPTVLPPGVADIELDWSRLTTSAMGNYMNPEAVTEVVVAKYSIDVRGLEENFLQLESLAVEMFRGGVLVGASLELDNLSTEDGVAFTGIDSEGTWIVALFCGDCSSPAPWYLSVLKPRPAP